MKSFKSVFIVLALTSCLLFSTTAKADSLWSNVLSGLRVLDSIFNTAGYNIFGSNSVNRLAQGLRVNQSVIQSLQRQGYSNGEIYYLLNLHKNTGMPIQRILELQTMHNVPLSFLPYYVIRENPRMVFLPMQTTNLQYDQFENHDNRFNHEGEHDNGLHLGQTKNHDFKHNDNHDKDRHESQGEKHGGGKGHGKGKD